METAPLTPESDPLIIKMTPTAGADPFYVTPATARNLAARLMLAADAAEEGEAR